MRLSLRDLLGGHRRRARRAKLNLCVPGGKETDRMLKRLLEEVPAAPVAAAALPAPDAAPAAADGAARLRAIRRSRPSSARRRRLNGDGLGEGHPPRRVRPRRQRPQLRAGRQLRPLSQERSGAGRCRASAALRAPAGFPGRRQADPRGADRGLRALARARRAVRADGYLAGGERRAEGRSCWRKGEDPDGDAATLDVLAALREVRPGRIPIPKRSWSAWSRCSRGSTRSPPRRWRRRARCI